MTMMLLLRLLLLALGAQAWSTISLRTSSTVKVVPPQDIHSFLSAPANWPRIVASSHSVSSPTSEVDLEKPLAVGEVVDEIFGLPPIIPLSVKWTCVKSDPGDGSLEFFAPEGLEGVARDCRMIMNVNRSNEEDASTVDLVIEYKPESFLGFLAQPVLALDNEVALKVLLPWAMATQLERFYQLMGSLYAIAGLSHLFDLVAGDSSILTMAGAPVFSQLPLLGKVYALLWSATGPMSFWLVTTGRGPLGLVIYGLLEIVGAALLVDNDMGSSTAFNNAVLIQVIVAASWLYSSQKSVAQEDAST